MVDDEWMAVLYQLIVRCQLPVGWQFAVYDQLNTHQQTHRPIVNMTRPWTVLANCQRPHGWCVVVWII